MNLAMRPTPCTTGQVHLLVYIQLYKVAIGPLTGRILYSYRSGSHVLFYIYSLLVHYSSRLYEGSATSHKSWNRSWKSFKNLCKSLNLKSLFQQIPSFLLC